MSNSGKTRLEHKTVYTFRSDSIPEGYHTMPSMMEGGGEP
jgi:hypothetical protein